MDINSYILRTARLINESQDQSDYKDDTSTRIRSNSRRDDTNHRDALNALVKCFPDVDFSDLSKLLIVVERVANAKNEHEVNFEFFDTWGFGDFAKKLYRSIVGQRDNPYASKTDNDPDVYESRTDVETGEDDYNAEMEFRDDEELASAKDSVSGDDQERARYEASIRAEIEADGEDVKSEEVDPKEVWKRIQGHKPDWMAADYEFKGSNGGKGVKSFSLDKVTVNGRDVTSKSLKSAFAPPPEEDSDEDEAGDEERADKFAKKNDFASAGAYSINPGDEVKAYGSITFANGDVKKVDGAVVQGKDNPTTVADELAALTNQKLVKGGVCEYYAILSLMLKKEIENLDDQGSALYTMYDRMSKDKTIEQIPSDEQEDREDGGDDSDENARDRFDDVEDFYASDDERTGDTSPEYGDIDRWGSTDESVGKNFVKWARLQG